MTANRPGVRVRLPVLLLALIASAGGDATFAQQPQPITYYLSEGATGEFFDTDVLIANPNNVSAPVTLTFSTQEGAQFTDTRNVPARSHITVRVDQIAGLGATSASVRVRSDDGVPLLVERTMFWDSRAYAGHTGSAVEQPSTDWYFAEGSQGFFDTFLLVINPNGSPTDVTFTYLRENEGPVVQTIQVGPFTRLTVPSTTVDGLRDRSFGISIHATQPITAERAMYFGPATGRQWSGGTESAGVTAPSTRWVLAEGATGSFFTTFVLMSNPNDAQADVTMQYLLDSGETVTVPKQIPGNTRLTVNIGAEDDQRLRNAAVSAVVNANVPIIVERSVYWTGAASPWGEGHNSFGVVEAGTRWGLAEGRDGGPLGFHTYILLANPQSSRAEVTVTYYREGGGAVSRTYAVQPTSRFNIDTRDVPELRGDRFGAMIRVTNDVPIIVERSMYWDTLGYTFSGGTNATGIRMTQTPVGGDDPGNGGGGGGGGTYPGFQYNLPTTRPYLSLADFAGVNQASAPYTRFKNYVDRALANNPDYGYTPLHAVIMFRLTNQDQYINHAIAEVDAMVAEAEVEIAAGRRAPLAYDSYLEVGWYIEQLAYTYDFGYSRLTASQRSRWEALANQAIFNVWHPSQAKWGSTTHTWSGWSINDPGNNYHFSFLKATMLWAWAAQSQELLTFLQTQKFTKLIEYYAALRGGGSREGTGYGTAHGNLFNNFLLWKSSTNENLSALTSHTRDTIDYWVHATVPTRNRFAPIGDQSRSSVPDIYDYHENLVHQAVVLSPGTDQARRGVWWLQHNSIGPVNNTFNAWGDLLPYPVQPLAPTARTYHAQGVGAFFARSGWETTATWFALVAGPYDQSHAHHDQGSITFYKNDWLVVTSNIWSHSGIHQEDEEHNNLRFTRANGSTIAQNPSETVRSSMTYTDQGGLVRVNADLSNAYSSNRSLVVNWTRDLEFSGDTLAIHDRCTVGSGVTPIFQLHVPVQPVMQPDDSIAAGALRIVPLHAVTASFVQMAGDHSKGWRVELRNSAACEFRVELRAQ